MSQVPMYDDLSNDYDRFVDWQSRLRLELPFIEAQLRAIGARRVVDVACGTGMHTIALAQRGYEMLGTDLSLPMIEHARANAQRIGVPVRFEVAGFGQLLQLTGGGYDAVLCLGNSLPHALAEADLLATLADFLACLAPAGLILVQNRNFDAVLSRQDRWMEPQSHQEGEREWLFLRFYDFHRDGTLGFNLWTLKRTQGAPWEQHVSATRLRPWQRTTLCAAMEAAGAEQVLTFGDLQGHPFDADLSPNLVLTARKKPGA